MNDSTIKDGEHKSGFIVILSVCRIFFPLVNLPGLVYV